jgi:hypothetical protein
LESEEGGVMAQEISHAEARLALSTIEHRRRQVIAENDMPRWQWWGPAAGRIGLGILADLDHPWLKLAVTLCFGAAHAVAASHVLSGRHRSHRLRVRADYEFLPEMEKVIGAITGRSEGILLGRRTFEIFREDLAESDRRRRPGSVVL